LGIALTLVFVWLAGAIGSNVVETELTLEEAVRLIVSGGIVVPEKLGKAYTVEPTNEVDFPSPDESDGSKPQSPSTPRSGHAG
jgi:uncharacterized membrane protein